MKDILISVVVPVYGVENRIRKFAKSLFSQTMTKGVEFIFVDDASKDNSISELMSELDNYPNVSHSIHVIKHEFNRGLPSARNTGLSAAHGEYVINFDSDDYLERDILERLYLKAKAENLDIVWSDWIEEREDGNSVKVTEPSYSNPEDALRAMLIGPMRYNVWNKLIRRDILINNHVSFPDGYPMGEDMTIMIIMASAQRVGKVDGYLYHYMRYSGGSITSAYSERNMLQLKYNVERVNEYLVKRFGERYDLDIAYMKLGIKSVYLVSGISWKYFKTWRTLFPEANIYAGKNSRAAKRISILEWCAARNMYPVIWLFNLFVVLGYNGIKRKLAGRQSR